MAKMCLKPKKRPKAPVAFPYKKKFLGVGGRKPPRGGSSGRCAPPPPEARFAAPPGAETTKTEPTIALHPRQQLFLTIQQRFQALDAGFEATRCTAAALTVSAHAASAPPPTLARFHTRQRFFRHIPMRAFSCHNVTPFAEIFLGRFAGQIPRYSTSLQPAIATSRARVLRMLPAIACLKMRSGACCLLV